MSELLTHTHGRCGATITAPRGQLTRQFLWHLLEECPGRYRGKEGT